MTGVLRSAPVQGSIPILFHLATGVLMALGSLSAASAQSPAAGPGNSAEALARAVWIAPRPLTASLLGQNGALAVTQEMRQPEDPWLGPDKALHFGASFLLTLSTQYVLVSKTHLPERRAAPISAGTALSLGLVKEIADSQRARHPLFSWRDLTANAVGVGLATALILL